MCMKIYFSNRLSPYQEWTGNMTTAMFEGLVRDELVDVLKDKFKAILVHDGRNSEGIRNVMELIREQSRILNKIKEDIPDITPDDIFIIGVGTVDTVQHYNIISMSHYDTFYGIPESELPSCDLFELSEESRNYRTIVTPEGATIAQAHENVLALHYRANRRQNSDSISLLRKILEEARKVYALSAEEIIEVEKKLRAERRERNIVTFATTIMGGELERLKSEVQRLNNSIKDYQEYLASSIRNYELKLSQLHAYETSSVNGTNKLIAEIRNLAKQYKVEDYDIVGETISIYTDDMIVELPDEYNAPPITIGKFKIDINLKKGQIKFTNLTKKRKSYWGDGCQHPHISDKGNACWGNIASAVAELMGQNEICALYSVLASYLESVNLNDPAGIYIYNWADNPKEVKSLLEGNYEEYCCAYCDDYIDVDYEDDWVLTVNGETHRFCCEECYENWLANNGTYCEQCGSWVEIENWIEDDLTDRRFCCDSCMEEYRQNNLGVCEYCDDYIHPDYDSYDEETGMHFCSDDCRVDYMDENGGYCEQCGTWIHEDGEYILGTGDTIFCDEECRNTYYDSLEPDQE